MTQFSRFWNTNGFDGGIGDGSAAYSQDEYRAYSMKHFPNGIVYDSGGDNLVVAGTSSPLTVSPGAAWVQGFFLTSDEEEDVAVTTPVTGTTGGRVVLRASWAASTVRIALKMSSDGVASIPDLTQTDGTTYEISLGTFTITTGGVITVTLDPLFSKPAKRQERLLASGTGVTDTGAISVNPLFHTLALELTSSPSNAQEITFNGAVTGYANAAIRTFYTSGTVIDLTIADTDAVILSAEGFDNDFAIIRALVENIQSQPYTLWKKECLGIVSSVTQGWGSGPAPVTSIRIEATSGNFSYRLYGILDDAF